MNLFQTYLEQSTNKKSLTVQDLLDILNSVSDKSMPIVVSNNKGHQTCVTKQDIKIIEDPYFGNDEVGSEEFENTEGVSFLNIGNA